MKVLKSILLSTILTVVTAFFYYNLLPIDIAIFTIVFTFLTCSKSLHMILNKNDFELLIITAAGQIMLYSIIFGNCLTVEMPEWFSIVMFALCWIGVGTFTMISFGYLIAKN